MTAMLFHGLPVQARESILECGVRSPSYWGTADVALEYAGDDGLVLAVPVDRFDQEDLRFNDLLAASLLEDGDDHVRLSGDWRGSITEFGSARYDATLAVNEEDFVSPDELRSRVERAGEIEVPRIAQ